MDVVNSKIIFMTAEEMKKRTKEFTIAVTEKRTNKKSAIANLKS